MAEDERVRRGVDVRNRPATTAMSSAVGDPADGAAELASDVLRDMTKRFDPRRIPGAAYALVLMIVVFAIVEPSILGSRNLTNVAYQMTPLLVISIGMTLVILSEGIDLSPGGVIGVVGVCMGLLLHGGMSWPLALAAGIGLGVAAGLVLGLVIAVGDIPPFVASLGMLGITAGAAVMITGGGSVPGFDRSVRALGEGLTPFLVGLAILGIFLVVLDVTRFGRYVRGIGGNAEAMVRTGVPIRAYKTAIYAVAGGLYSVAAFLMLAHDNAAHPEASMGIEFEAIAATIVGGTSFENGRGSLWGTLAGAAMIAFLRSGLNYLGMPTTWQLPVIGVVLILAIIVNVLMQRSLLTECGRTEVFA